MCGLAGIFNLDNSPVNRDVLLRMSDAVAHRGPDSSDYITLGSIGLAHRRLAILDTSSKGNQPMQSKDGKWVIVFNGCIYNFPEIRQDLKSQGHEFVSDTDTEVIVESLSRYGTAVFSKFNGMFAVAAWNKQTSTLYLSRDRYGVKPLYYYFDGKILLFASEIKAFMAHPGFKVKLNEASLNEYFTFQNLFTFRTLFEGVEMLPPANTVAINADTSKISHNSWWDYDFTQTLKGISFSEAKEETNRLFKQAVTRQMIADVPVGSYLSGGMDSGSITAVASSLTPRLSTFTCGFDMSAVTGVEANYDERRDAEMMASYFKTEHFEQVINAGDIRWSLPRLVYHLEDLRVGMSYPNYYIARLASKFVKVCLQGTGGDELFGGYPWRYYRVFDALNQKQFFDQYYGFWQRLVPDEDKILIFQNNVIKKIEINEPRQIFERVFTFNEKLRYDTPEQHINNSLYFEIKTFLPGLFLVGDKLSMAHGLEERFPFMDNDLVEFAMKIPVSFKLGNFSAEVKKIDENIEKKKRAYQDYTDGKNILRKAMLDFIPKEIIDRRKQGFSAPDESWYRGENAEYVKELLINKKTISTEFINRDYITKIVDEHINKNINHRLLIWSLMNFEWWCRIFLNGEKSGF